MANPLALWVRSADRVAGMPVTDWLAFSCEVGRFTTQGSASLSVRANDPWITNSALDIGGATTDIHSVAQGSPEIQSILECPEPLAKRTVEGDLGVHVNAANIYQQVKGDRCKKTD